MRNPKKKKIVFIVTLIKEKQILWILWMGPEGRFGCVCLLLKNEFLSFLIDF